MEVSGQFLPGEEIRYPLHRRWDFGEKKTVLPLTRYQTPHTPTCRLVTIPTIKQVTSRPAEHQAHDMQHAN